MMTMQETRQLVAVYGTLKMGNRLNRYMNQTGTTIFLGEGYFYGELYTNTSFPAVKNGKNKVACEIYEVDDYTMDVMDYLESDGSIYQRKITEVFIDGEKDPVYAWVYFYMDEDSLKPFMWFPVNPNKDGLSKF